MGEAQIHEFTNIDPWFLAQLGGLHAAEAWLRTQSLDSLSPEDWGQAKRRGFSDPQLAAFVGAPQTPPSTPNPTLAAFLGALWRAARPPRLHAGGPAWPLSHAGRPALRDCGPAGRLGCSTPQLAAFLGVP